MKELRNKELMEVNGGGQWGTVITFVGDKITETSKSLPATSGMRHAGEYIGEKVSDFGRNLLIWYILTNR